MLTPGSVQYNQKRWDHGEQLEENSNGALFHQWLMDHHLFLPQTFEVHHSGSHDTWEHGRGVRARLDYVALDESLRHPHLRTSVLEDLDLGIQRLDHMAVRAGHPVACG